jgi:hypothetical protein
VTNLQLVPTPLRVAAPLEERREVGESLGSGRMSSVIASIVRRRVTTRRAAQSARRAGSGVEIVVLVPATYAGEMRINDSTWRRDT